MANNYRIEVRVEIVKCEAEVTAVPTRQGDGQFVFTLSESQACDIDRCEQALLRTNYEALREALEHHLSTVSQEKALAVAGSMAEVQVKPYRVEGEVGRIVFDAHCVIGDGEVIYDTSTELFPPLHAKEWYRTQGFKELALVYGTVDDSYRKTSALLNRVRYQEEDGTPMRTLRDNTEYEGRHLLNYLNQQATDILQAQGFTTEGTPVAEASYQTQALVALPEEQVIQAIHACAPKPELVTAMVNNPVSYEDPAHSTNIAIDDVGVKRQKATRRGSAEASAPEQKRIHHTVARIAQGAASYVVTGYGVVNVLRIVLAFLLHNDLLKNNLIFFVDGQRTLHAAILQAFAWFKAIRLILDWYHLEEKCKQLLSLALKGRAIRNEVLTALCPLLWCGCVEQAIALLQTITADQVKDPAALEDLIGYLMRNRPYIPCYAVRKRLGLPNSSQAGEKANDLIVATRQKHNGMSWSQRGSVALAAVTAMVRNREYRRWFQTQTLAFAFAA